MDDVDGGIVVNEYLVEGITTGLKLMNQKIRMYN